MNKRTAAVAALLLCLLLGAAHVVDLLFFTDPATGFVRAGQAWYRYVAAAVAAAALYVLSRPAARHPAALFRPRRWLGAAMVLAALLLLDAGLSTVISLGQDAYYLVQGVLLAVCGLWYGVSGVRAMAAPARQPAPAALGLLALGAPACMAVERFAIRPASLARTGHILQVLSILAMLCFTVTLMRVLYLPGAPIGQGMAFTGMLAFLFGTCLELPQTVLCWMAGGSVTLLDLSWSACWAAVGLCGLVCALYTAGEEITPKRQS